MTRKNASKVAEVAGGGYVSIEPSREGLNTPSATPATAGSTQDLAAPATPATPAILGLDLSLAATGIARPDGTLDTIRPTTEGDRRLIDIAGQVLAHGPAARKPDLVVLEDVVVRSGASSVLGMLHGAMRAKLLEFGLPYLTVPPATLKVYACGKGNATKPDMRMALYKRTGADVADDNRVDAAWLRLLALDHAGHPKLDLPQTHRRALTKLHRLIRCPHCGHTTIVDTRPPTCHRCRHELPQEDAA